MNYQTVKKAVFLERPNRFIAHCRLGEEQVTAHVKNTGRCRELLIPGVTVYLEYSPAPQRKTDYSLIAVEKGERLINMDSQAPNRVVAEALAQGRLPLNALKETETTAVHPEYRMDGSRLDFMVETGRGPVYIEVKGVTLEENGVVLFPDAPTERGVKHLQELTSLARSGQRAALVLVVQMERVDYFTPNSRTHPQFGQAMAEARAAGVELCCCDCTVTPESLTLGRPVEIRL